jgi:predicted nucleic acid-binding Zn ribbon protein
MPETEVKHCLACDKLLHGRADKKFCNDYCRNAYNNSLKSMNDTAVRNINNVLAKNRKILDGILKEEKTAKTNKEKLLQQGFNFRYITHTYTNKNGDTYCFCYEMGYLPLDNDWYLIVRRKDESAAS